MRPTNPRIDAKLRLLNQYFFFKYAFSRMRITYHRCKIYDRKWLLVTFINWCEPLIKVIENYKWTVVVSTPLVILWYFFVIEFKVIKWYHVTFYWFQGRNSSSLSVWERVRFSPQPVRPKMPAETVVLWNRDKRRYNKLVKCFPDLKIAVKYVALKPITSTKLTNLHA